MAKFYIKDFVKSNDFSGIVAVSWQVALDKDFLLIVDETYKNTDNVEVWHSPLKKIDGPGLYDDKTKFYVRCKIYTKNMNEMFESDWYTAKLNDEGISKSTYLTDADGNKISKIVYDDSEQGYHIEY